jgi:hypothetical protein
MQNMKNRKMFKVMLVFIFSPLFIYAQTTQDNPLSILHTSTPPAIDGVGNDKCWESVKWQTIGEVWIPSGGSVSYSDYTGRYKVMWSSSTNLLYFLIEVTDDVIVGGYTANNGTCYNYDITEVFIDENRSGGEHRYDGTSTNAENAFAYHMYCDYPADGQIITNPYFEDMSGPQSSSKWVDRTSHFPEFVLRRDGNTYTREFSLIVYNDTYSDTNKDSARVKLSIGKEMGLSVAYCDNDGLNENPKTRDNMFGSVIEPPENWHWRNADYFGKVILTDDAGIVGVNEPMSLPTGFKLEQNYPNPFNPSTVLRYGIPKESTVKISIYNALGQKITELVDKIESIGYHSINWNASKYSSGVYIYRLDATPTNGDKPWTQTKKMIFMK